MWCRVLIRGKMRDGELLGIEHKQARIQFWNEASKTHEIVFVPVQAVFAAKKREGVDAPDPAPEKKSADAAVCTVEGVPLKY